MATFLHFYMAANKIRSGPHRPGIDATAPALRQATTVADEDSGAGLSPLGAGGEEPADLLDHRSLSFFREGAGPSFGEISGLDPGPGHSVAGSQPAVVYTPLPKKAVTDPDSRRCTG